MNFCFEQHIVHLFIEIYDSILANLRVLKMPKIFLGMTKNLTHIQFINLTALPFSKTKYNNIKVMSYR